MDQSKHSTDMERPFNPRATNLWGKTNHKQEGKE
jgi:hypothetical protein